MPQGLVRLPLLEVDLVDGLPRPQGFDDGVAPLDDTVGLGGQVLFSPFFHKLLPRFEFFRIQEVV